MINTIFPGELGSVRTSPPLPHQQHNNLLTGAALRRVPAKDSETTCSSVASCERCPPCLWVPTTVSPASMRYKFWQMRTCCAINSFSRVSVSCQSAVCVRSRSSDRKKTYRNEKERLTQEAIAAYLLVSCKKC